LNISWWVAFNAFVLAMLALDIGVLHRKAHTVRVREALFLTAFWIGLALLFNFGVYLWFGHDKALEFLTCYLIEESLSVDNLFVFLMLFSYFGVEPKYQHKVLFWGILGAVVMRLIFILAGVALIQKLYWVVYIFGAFLVFTGIRMAFPREREVHPERNPVLRLFRRFMPVTSDHRNGRFFVREAGRYLATPLFVVVLAVETTDVIFAIDSIPAALAISHDPFIVYTANIFAVLGLRSIFFALAGIMEMFRYLHYGLAVVLAFTGVKMLLSHHLHIPLGFALAFIVGVLLISIIASVLRPTKDVGGGD